MAHIAERLVDSKAPKGVPCVEGQWSADDERHESERGGGGEKPHQQWTTQRSGLRDVIFRRGVHRKCELCALNFVLCALYFGLGLWF